MLIFGLSSTEKNKNKNLSLSSNSLIYFLETEHFNLLKRELYTTLKHAVYENAIQN